MLLKKMNCNIAGHEKKALKVTIMNLGSCDRALTANRPQRAEVLKYILVKLKGDPLRGDAYQKSQVKKRH